MPGQYQDYHDADIACEAYVAGTTAGERRPCVLVSHQWSGQSDAERETADRLAGLGYVAIAIDNYGKGRRGTTPEENTALMSPLMADRAALRQRLLAAIDFAKAHPAVDPARIAIAGYCFGGLCALDVARSGADVRGAVSIHGIFAAPHLGEQGAIGAKILVLHGWEDPMAKPDDVLALTKELTDAGADWQLHAYGHAMHAFTNEGANMPERGLLYDEAAAQRSWRAMEDFLAEVLV